MHFDRVRSLYSVNIICQSKTTIVLVVFILSSLLSIISLKYFPGPYIWISLSWFGFLIFSTILSKTPFLKAMWLNIGVFFIVFGIFEAYLWIFSKNQVNGIRCEGTYTKGYFVDNDILGYAPPKGVIVTSAKYHGKDLIYNVTYTINSYGLRISPPSQGNKISDGVLFFGGSYTFGEGVEDYETLPYVVGKKSTYRIANFGFHGYGPHQMLSTLEHGLVDAIDGFRPKIAIYHALVDHIWRSAGFSSWDLHGPRYIIAPSGKVEYKGHFDDNFIIPVKIRKLLNKSFTYAKVLNRRDVYTKNNMKLFLGIVDTSKKIFLGKYPNSLFHVILWDTGNKKVVAELLHGLREKDVQVHLISNILPNYAGNRAIYQINEYDKHPNAKAYERIAQYVVDKILGK